MLEVVHNPVQVSSYRRHSLRGGGNLASFPGSLPGEPGNEASPNNSSHWNGIEISSTANTSVALRLTSASMTFVSIIV